MQVSEALAYFAGHRHGVLATMKRDGRPQMSNIVYSITDAGIIRISTTTDRAKARNIRRDPRVSLHVTPTDFRSFVVVEGQAEVSPVAAELNDAVVTELADMHRAVLGEHQDWAQFRDRMLAEQRCVIRITPTRAYGQPPRG